MRRRFLSSLATLTDPHVGADGTDETVLVRTIARERIRVVLVIFCFMCEFALSIMYINLFVGNFESVIPGGTTNELELFLLYFILIGGGLRLELARDIFSQTEVIFPHIYFVRILLFLSIIPYLTSFIISSIHINQPIEYPIWLLLAVTSWTGLALSLLACVFSIV